MTRQDVRRAMFECLSAVAPEADPTRLDPAADLREELDIDSMDFLRYVTGLHKALGVEIPESDYPRLFTLGEGETYLVAAAGASE